MDIDSTYIDEPGYDQQTCRRAVRFFWVVLIAASGASIAGNAVHAAVNVTAMPPALAAAVATAPPLVLLASTEGVSLLIKVRRRPSIAYWAALIMTILLAAAAFRLSFDALRDLATRCGIRQNLAWLWPVAVDVTMTQATVSLLALTRIPATPVPARQPPHPDRGDHLSIEDSAAQDVPMPAWLSASATPLDPAGPAPASGKAPRERRHDDQAARVVASRRTKQPPEVVAAVLQRHAAGQKVSEIGVAFNLHHSTVSRIVANGAHAGATA